jgi:hypothetical protein
LAPPQASTSCTKHTTKIPGIDKLYNKTLEKYETARDEEAQKLSGHLLDCREKEEQIAVLNNKVRNNNNIGGTDFGAEY